MLIPSVFQMILRQDNIGSRAFFASVKAELKSQLEKGKMVEASAIESAVRTIINNPGMEYESLSLNSADTVQPLLMFIRCLNDCIFEEMKEHDHGRSTYEILTVRIETAQSFIPHCVVAMTTLKKAHYDAYDELTEDKSWKSKYGLVLALYEAWVQMSLFTNYPDFEVTANLSLIHI